MMLPCDSCGLNCKQPDNVSPVDVWLCHRCKPDDDEEESMVIFGDDE